VLAWLEEENLAELGEPHWNELRRRFAPISSGYLRTLLRAWSQESGVPLAPMVEGVRQENFDNLEHSLIALLKEYERGDAARRIEVRRRVIEAKDHARWAAHAPEKRGQKEEMVLWMLTWLENPPLFPEWAQLRRRSWHGEVNGAR
jgi:hypothetical protein